MNDINPFAGQHADIRQGVRDLCSTFDSSYWQQLEESSGYPEAFVQALTEAGWLAALIPEEFGGSGVGLTEASVILEEINRSGANSGACHAQMYTMGALLRHGSPEQKRRYLPRIASGELRLQSFGVTEPTTGTDTTKIKTFAEKRGESYLVNGQKVWISRVQHSDLLLLLARTTPLEQVKKKTEGLSPCRTSSRAWTPSRRWESTPRRFCALWATHKKRSRNCAQRASSEERGENE